MSTLVGEGKMSVLMVEQNVGQVLNIAHRVYVMRSGRMILHETAEQMRKREQLWDLFDQDAGARPTRSGATRLSRGAG